MANLRNCKAGECLDYSGKIYGDGTWKSNQLFLKEIMLCDVKYDDVIQSKLFCSFGFGSSN